MKKWIFCLGVLVLFSYGFAQLQLKGASKKSLDEHNQVPVGTLSKNERMLKVTKDQIFKGNLLLVNADHPVPSMGVGSEAVTLSQHRELVKEFGLLDNTIRLSPSMVQKFSTMIKTAQYAGVNHFLISSGYRDDEEQNQLYQQRGANYALPAGYSEHNLGLSLDIGSTQGEMNKVSEGVWLKKNAWDYGFILRYPKDKTAITGIQYEAWHFRYVGLPHSVIMRDKNFVLEEYLDYLKEKKRIKTTINHRTYEIRYYPVSQKTSIPVPANGHYEISGNNMDGVIVTVFSN